jgi:hypothetical protein
LRHKLYSTACQLVRLVLVLALPLSQAQGQTAPTEAAPKGALSASLGYSNNSAFYGRTQAIAYPYASGELTYTSKFGVWASVSASNLLNTSAFVDETDLSLGWDKDLTKKIDVSASYSRFFFAPNSPLVKSSVNNFLEVAAGYDWGYVYSRLSADVLFGPDSHDGFLVLDNSRYFALKTLGKGVLSTEPKASLIAGTQNFDEVSVIQQIKRGNNGKNKGKGNQIVITTHSTRFDVLAYDLQVPLSYTVGKVAGEVTYRYLVPVNVLPDDDSSARSFVMGTLTVTF